MKLLKYFKNWEYSLFNIPSSLIQLVRADSLSLNHELQRWTAPVNMAAASHLIQDEASDEVLSFITCAVEFDPTSIHAWCNKGVYHLLSPEPDMEQAIEAKSKMEDLLLQEDALVEAKVAYGYWLFEKVRATEMRKKGLDLLEEVLSGQTRKTFLHYAFMKVLVRKAKNKVDYEEDVSWLPEVLKEMLKQMEILARSGDPKYEIEVWIYLADVQQANHCMNMLMENMSTEVRQLSEATGTRRSQQLNMEFCISKMLELEANPAVIADSNFYARLGKFHMRLATGEQSEEKRLQLLEKSIKYGEDYESVEAGSDTELGPAFCAQALFNIWAVKYFAANTARIKTEYSALSGVRGKPQTQYIWKWLCDDYYSTIPDENPETRRYLERARDHLMSHYAAGGHFISMSPRVRMLLGDPVTEVEAEFTDYCQQVANHSKVIFCQNYGRFLECIGRRDEGIQQYVAAIRTNNTLHGSSFKPFLAIYGLKRNKVAIPRR